MHTTVTDQVKKIFDNFNARISHYTPNVFDYEDECYEESEEDDMSTEFLRIQKKNKFINLKRPLECYVKFLAVFGFKCGRYDLNLMKSYLFRYLLWDSEIEQTVIKEANDFILFKIGDVQFREAMKRLGQTTTLESLLKANKASELMYFSLTSGLIMQICLIVQNFHETIPFSTS